MTQPPISEIVCPACSTPGSGRFCANCGVSLETTTCAGCEASLSPGARFCPRCGRPVGANIKPTAASTAPTATPGSSLPWIVGAIALVCLLAFFAGNFYKAKPGSTLDAPQNALPQAGLDDRAPLTDGGQVVRAPDISQLSPEERADRLFNRVMLLNSEGKGDSVLFFAPMAIEAYRLLSPMNADQRYDMGRIAEVAEAYPLAAAQADTILQQYPTHLLGLILAARIAGIEKQSAQQVTFTKRLLAAVQSETAKRLPEYDRHQADITAAVANAKQNRTVK